ncbi:MAG TPA: hypothetical protein VLF89_08935 [Candidatus Saccharimonadales bacterium]|nr:hypothetical protein [Candidatus Saccharimonadales bacterium]
MQYKIGIFGSAVINNEDLLSKAHELGKALSKYDLMLITGAGKGIPYQVVSEAKKRNEKIKIWGFPPVLDKQALQEYTSDDIGIYDKITYIPQDYAFANSIHACRLYRNAASTSHCDAGIIISGRFGTLNEFTNMQEEKKVIGVLIGTGGIADELQQIVSKVTKEDSAQVIFNNDPKELVKEVLEALEKQKA